MNQFITIISSCFLLSFVYSFFLHKKNIPLSLNKRAFLLRTVTQNTVGDSSSQENADEDKMTRMIELIVSSVEEGREDDLRRAGLKVTKKSARETLDDKLIDPEIQNTIFGPMTSEDKSVMEMLERVCQQEQNLDSSSVTTTTDKSSSSITNGIDSAMFAELKEEAMQTLEELRRKGSVMGALLDDQEQFGTTINPLIRPSTIHPSNSQQIPTTSSSTVDDKVIPGGAMDPSVWGTSTPGVESMLSPVDPMKYIEWMNEGYEGPLIVGAAVEEMECDEPEPSTDETTPVANPLYNGGNGVAGSQHYELPIRNSVTQQFMNTVTATTTATTTTTDTTTTTTATTDPKALSVEALLMNPGLSDSPNSLESKFAALLKASMNAQQVQAEVGATDSNSKDSLVLTRKNLVEAVTTGQSNGIDIETLLGSTMASLAKQLNVNVADTLSEKDSMAEMQVGIFIYLYICPYVFIIAIFI